MTVNKAMSDKEKQEFKKDIEIALVKKWWPFVAGVFGAMVFAVTFTWWVAHNIATTSDTDKIMTKVEDINKQLANMGKDYVTTPVAYNAHKVIHNRIDSLGRVVANRRATTAVTAHRDKFGNVTYRPYIN
jgi:hypothetical protein